MDKTSSPALSVMTTMGQSETDTRRSGLSSVISQCQQEIQSSARTMQSELIAAMQAVSTEATTTASTLTTHGSVTTPMAWNMGTAVATSGYGRPQSQYSDVPQPGRATSSSQTESRQEAPKQQFQDVSRVAEEIRQLCAVVIDNARNMAESVVKEQDREATAYEASIQRRIIADKKLEASQEKSKANTAGSKSRESTGRRVTRKQRSGSAKSARSRNNRSGSKKTDRGSRGSNGAKGRGGGMGAGMGMGALSRIPGMGLFSVLMGAIEYGSELLEQAEKVSESVRESEIVDVTSRGEERVQNAQAASEASHARQGATVDLSQFTALKHLSGDRETEAKIREVESRTDLTPEQKAQYRQRAQEDHGFNQQHSDLRQQRSDIQNREGLLDSSMSQAIERKKVIESARDSSLNVIASKKREVLQNPSFAGMNTHKQKEEMDKFDQQAAQIQLESAMRLKQVQEEVKAIEEQRITLAEQKVAVDQKAIGVTRAQKQKAYEDVRDHKEGMRQDSIKIGMSTPGERGKLKMVDQMISRIKDQQRRKAAGEDVTVEKMPAWAMEFAKANGLGTQTVHEQAIQNERELNLENKDRSEGQLKEKEEHLAKLEASPQEKEDEENLSSSMDQLKTASSNAMKSIDSVLEITKIVNGLEGALKRVEADLKVREAMRGGLISAYL